MPSLPVSAFSILITPVSFSDTHLDVYKRQLKKRVKYKFVPVRLNTSFRTVLKCYQVFSDTLLTDFEKAEACLWLLVKSKLFLKILTPDKKAALFNLIFKEFIDVSDKKAGGEKYFDFNQDAWAVYSSLSLIHIFPQRNPARFAIQT